MQKIIRLRNNKFNDMPKMLFSVTLRIVRPTMYEKLCFYSKWLCTPRSIISHHECIWRRKINFAQRINVQKSLWNKCKQNILTIQIQILFLDNEVSFEKWLILVPNINRYMAGKGKTIVATIHQPSSQVLVLVTVLIISM